MACYLVGAIQVAYSLTQLGPLNTELSAAGGSAFHAVVPLTTFLLYMPKVLLARLLSEHYGLLICAICSDAPPLRWCNAHDITETAIGYSQPRPF